MTKVRQDTSDETRRRLLKGALGASTVVTLGYGGSAAAASLGCVEKVDGGYPTTQFIFAEEPPTVTGTKWAWKRVDVRRYKEGGSGQNIDGFEVGGKVYHVTAPHSEFQDPVVRPDGGNYPKDGWVLAYFDYDGNEIGSYPTYTAQNTGYAPAPQSCLASINAGIVGGYRFGG